MVTINITLLCCAYNEVLTYRIKLIETLKLLMFWNLDTILKRYNIGLELFSSLLALYQPPAFFSLSAARFAWVSAFFCLALLPAFSSCFVFLGALPAASASEKLRKILIAYLWQKSPKIMTHMQRIYIPIQLVQPQPF